MSDSYEAPMFPEKNNFFELTVITSFFLRSLKIQRIGIKCKTLLGIVVNHNFIEIGYISGLGSQVRIDIGNDYDTVQLGSIVAIHTEYGIDPLVGIEFFGSRGYKLHGCSRLIGPIVTFPESHESYPARYRFVHQHVNVCGVGDNSIEWSDRYGHHTGGCHIANAGKPAPFPSR